MRIGQLAARAGATPRQVRFYEAQGLITSARGPNNYREYDETALGRVKQIRELLQSGLPIPLIRRILPCLQSPLDPVVFEGVTEETVAALVVERDRLNDRIAILTRNRDAVDVYLGELRARAQAPAAAGA